MSTLYVPTQNNFPYLRNNSEAWTKILESNGGYINAINNNPSTSSLQNTEQG